MPDDQTVVIDNSKATKRRLLEEQDRRFRALLHRRAGAGRMNADEQKALAKKIKDDEKQKDAALEQQKTDAEFKPAYEARLALLMHALSTLQTLRPVTETTLAQLRKMRDEAGAFATAAPPDWKKAAEALKKEAIARAEDDAFRNYRERRDNLTSNATTAAAATKGAAVADKFRHANIPAEGRHEIGGALDAAYAILLKPGVTASDATRALTAFATAERRMDALVAAADQAYNAYKARSAAFGAIATLESIGPRYLPDFGEADLADLRRRKTDADAAAAFNDYVVASQRLAELQTDCDRLIADANAARRELSEDLQTAKRRAADGIAALDKLANPTGAAPPADLVQAAQKISTDLKNFDAVTIDAPDVRATIAAIEQMLISAESVAERADAAPEFVKEKAKLVAPVDAKLASLAQAVDALDQTLAGNAGIDAAVRTAAITALHDAVAKAKGDWTARVAASFDYVSLDADGALEALQPLQEKIAAAGAPKAIAALENQRAILAERQELQKKLAAAEPLVDVSISVAPKSGLDFARAVEKARLLVESGDNLDELKTMQLALEKQTAAAEKSASAAQVLIARERERINAICRQVAAQLDDLRGDIGKKPASDKRRTPYENMLAKLYERTTTIGKLADTSDLVVLADALADAGQLKADSERTVAGWNKTADKDPNSLDAVRRSLDTAEAKFKAFGDGDYVLVSQQAVSDSIDKARKALGAEDPIQTAKKVAEIESATAAMIAKATTGKKNYEQIAEICKGIEKKLTGGLGKTVFEEHGPDYVKEVQAKLQVLRANGKFEDGFAQARKDLQDLEKSLDDMLATPVNMAGVPVTLFDAQARAKEGADKKELQKKAFEGEAKALRSEFAYAKHSAASAKEVAKFEKELEFATRQTAGSQGDYATALSKVRAIRTQLADLADFPGGLKITARNNLPLVRKVYTKAVMKYSAQLDELGATLGLYDLSDDEQGIPSQPQAAAIKLELTRLRALFSPVAFHATVKKMTAAAEGTAAKSKARERGLRQARRMLKRLQKDHRLRLLTKNPFVPELRKTISQLNVALLDIENNMLVSM